MSEDFSFGACLGIIVGEPGRSGLMRPLGGSLCLLDSEDVVNLVF